MKVSSGGAEISGELLASAKQLHQPNTRRRKGVHTAWATAAALVLAVLAFTMTQQTEIPDVISQPASATTDYRDVRSLDRKTYQPAITAPAAGAFVSSSELVIRWTPVAGALHYDVRVVDNEGFMIWQGRSETVELAVPTGSGLNDGAEYYLRVDAYLAEANSIRSAHVPITIQENTQ